MNATDRWNGHAPIRPCESRTRLPRRTLALTWAAVASGLLLAGLAFAQPGPSPRPIVADVIIQGNRNVQTQQLMSRLKTKPGEEFSEYNVQEDLRTLTASRQFSSVENKYTREPDGKIKVYFLLRDFPNLVQAIRFEGPKHLKDDELEKLVAERGVRTGLPLNPLNNKLACQSISDRLKETGRGFAQCELLSGDRPGDEEVVFNITEGPRIAVRSIEFEGNTFLRDAVLRQHVNQGRKYFGVVTPAGYFNAAMAENDIHKLEDYYKQFGYLDVKVSLEKRWEEDSRDVTLIFHILEGKRYEVKASPELHGIKSMPLEQLQNLSAVKQGEFFDQQKIERDIERMKSAYGYDGREVQARWTPVYSRENPGLVELHYEFEEKQPVRVGQVFIAGNTRTRQHVILREVPLYPGQVLAFPDVRQGERNLQKLNIFKSSPDGMVHPQVSVLENQNEPNSEFRDILVQVEEDNTGSLQFGVGVNSDSGLTGTIILNERNFDILRPPTSFEDLLSGNAWRGGGQEFRMEAVPGTQLQRYSVSFREPRLFDSPYSLGVGGYYFTRGYDEYTENRLGGRLTLGRRLGDHWSVSAGLRVENVGVFDIPEGAPPEITDFSGSNFLIAPRGSVAYDTRDSWVRPTEGGLTELSYEQGLGDYTFPVANLEANRYFTAWSRRDGSGKHVVALRSQIGYCGSDTPVYERFYGGGYRSIRGFSFRGVGPDVNGYKVGGNFLFVNSAEYQVPLLANDQVYAVGFVDSGTVEQDVSITDYRVAAGFGFRFIVPIFGPMPIALDFGFPIVKGQSDQTQIFAFFVGFSR